MIIRNYIPEKDGDEVRELAGRNGINLSEDSKILVAENENGEIKAICGVRFVPAITFVSESPTVAFKLWNYVCEKLTKGKIKIVMCFADGDKKVNLYKKLGFYECFENHKILEKIFNQ